MDVDPTAVTGGVWGQMFVEEKAEVRSQYSEWEDSLAGYFVATELVLLLTFLRMSRTAEPLNADTVLKRAAPDEPECVSRPRAPHGIFLWQILRVSRLSSSLPRRITADKV